MMLAAAILVPVPNAMRIPNLHRADGGALKSVGDGRISEF
jgi:hypothetical protein